MSTYPHYLERLQAATRKYWDKPALNTIGGESLTYAEMATAIARFHIIFEKAGFKKGDKIALNSSKKPVSRKVTRSPSTPTTAPAGASPIWPSIHTRPSSSRSSRTSSPRA